MLSGVQVAAANAAAERLDQHLTLARCGIFYVVDNEVAVTENRSAHNGLLPIFRSSMAAVSCVDQSIALSESQPFVLVLTAQPPFRAPQSAGPVRLGARPALRV